MCRRRCPERHRARTNEPGSWRDIEVGNICACEDRKVLVLAGRAGRSAARAALAGDGNVMPVSRICGRFPHPPHSATVRAVRSAAGRQEGSGSLAPCACQHREGQQKDGEQHECARLPPAGRSSWAGLIQKADRRGSEQLVGELPAAASRRTITATRASPKNHCLGFRDDKRQDR